MDTILNFTEKDSQSLIRQGQESIIALILELGQMDKEIINSLQALKNRLAMNS